MESVVLALIRNRSNKVVLFGDLGGLNDLGSRPFTGSPVVGEVEVTDGLGEAFDNLLHRGGRIVTVCKDNVDVGLFQTLERRLQSLNDVLLGETASVGLLAARAKEDLLQNISNW